MRRRPDLILCAVIVLGSWAICAWVYAVDGGGGYNGGPFAALILATALLTIGAALVVVRAARSRSVWVSLGAFFVSGLAAVSILLLAVAINSRG